MFITMGVKIPLSSPLLSPMPSRTFPIPSSAHCLSDGSPIALLVRHSARLAGHFLETRDLGRFPLNLRGRSTSNFSPFLATSKTGLASVTSISSPKAGAESKAGKLETRTLLCRASSESFDEGHGGRVEEMDFGSFSSSDGDREDEIRGQAEHGFVDSWRASPNGTWLSTRDGENTEKAFESLRELEETRRVEEESSLLFKELRASLSHLDGSFGTGSPIFEHYGDQKSPSDERNSPTPLRPRGSMDPRRDSDVRGIPTSLRLLRHKQNYASGVEKTADGMKQTLVAVGDSGVGKTDGIKETLIGFEDSFKTAFSSMVFMIRSLQTHTLHLRKLLFYEDLQEVVNRVHTELHESFLWLFQQVFSCTPKLMVLTMILLADFTVYSMGKNVALAAIPPAQSPSSSVSVLRGGLDNQVAESLADRSSGGIRIGLQDSTAGLSTTSMNEQFGPFNIHNGAGDGGGSKSMKVEGGADGNAWSGREAESRAMYSEDDITVADVPNSLAAPQEQVESSQEGGSSSSRQLVEGLSNSGLELDTPSSSTKSSDDGGASTRDDHHLLRLLWKAVSEELQSRPGESHYNFAPDQETRQRLVAPVAAQLEPDDYICYDRTELNYQHAISLDPSNPLLLANYAQFLYLVRHNHNRAEELFHRAMKADPVDGEAIGRFASFLWVARGDLAAAERAYRAAVTADPSNPFHAGCYAHFLWNSQDEDTTCHIGV